MTKPFTIAISAGGKSSRMGTDKSFVNILGKPLIEHIIERVADVGQEETILITNRLADYAHLTLPMYSDVLPDKGSLGGIYSAIYHSKCEYTLVIACDMPFVSTDLLRFMAMLRDDDPYDVIVPRVDKYPQGLHALYSRRCLEPIRKRLDADRLKVIGFYDDVRVRYIDEEEYVQFDEKGLAFYNVNTPEDLKKARKLAEE
ncbi:MAG: molybdenum cofactor guanylyltransferase [Anaerolineae bacterium]|nr:molybdenum cofactor guanylyltransferase [Anaerolineae bacterium]